METVPEDVTEEVTEVTPVEALSDQQDSEDEVMSVEVEIEQEGATNSSDETVGKTGEDSTKQKPEVPTETLVERIDEEVMGAVGGRVEASVDNLASDHKPIGAKRSFDHLGETVLILIVC